MTSHTFRLSSIVLGCVVSVFVTACGEKKSEQAPAAATAADTKPALRNGLTEEQSKQVLAKIGDTTITLGQFADRLASQSPYLRARYNSPERRREFLDNMVRFELLALEAKKRGHDKLPDVERVRRQMMVQEMMKEQFDDKGVKLSDITDEQIKTYYDAHVDEFNKPEQRRASWILFKDKASGKAKAEAALKKAQASGDDMEAFRKLADQYNEDSETKDRAGDLRFFSRIAEPGDSGPPKAVRDAVFSMEKTGDVYPNVVDSEQGLAVLKMTGRARAARAHPAGRAAPDPKPAVARKPRGRDREVRRRAACQGRRQRERRAAQRGQGRHERRRYAHADEGDARPPGGSQGRGQGGSGGQAGGGGREEREVARVVPV